jgi:hypothetical protein
MRKLLIALCACAAFASATPAMACHGHDTPDGWDINVGSWANSEVLEMKRLAERVELITHEPLSIKGNIPWATAAALVEILECKKHMTHEGAIEKILDIAKGGGQ